MNEKIIDGLQREIERSLEQLAETEDVGERKAISKTLRNLGDTAVGFMDLAARSMEDLLAPDFDDLFDEDEDGDLFGGR